MSDSNPEDKKHDDKLIHPPVLEAGLGALSIATDSIWRLPENHPLRPIALDLVDTLIETPSENTPAQERNKLQNTALLTLYGLQIVVNLPKKYNPNPSFVEKYCDLILQEFGIAIDPLTDTGFPSPFVDSSESKEIKEELVRFADLAIDYEN